jgi:hypothetical protein
VADFSNVICFRHGHLAVLENATLMSGSVLRKPAFDRLVK